MKVFFNVKGTQEIVPNIEVNIDTVYVRSNITRIETEDFVGWQYDENQYSLSEYQALIGNKAKSLETDVNDVAEIVAINFEDSIALGETIAYLITEIETLKSRR